jgi:hypothetical protein
MMQNPDIVLPFLKGRIGLKWKGNYFLFIQEGDCKVEFADFCEMIKREQPGIALVNIEEIQTSLLHPGAIDAEGYSQINVKDYVMNRPFMIEVRITRIVKNSTKGAF